MGKGLVGLASPYHCLSFGLSNVFYIFFVAFYKIIQKERWRRTKKENNGETKLNMTQIFTPVQFFLYPILSKNFFNYT